MRVSTALALLAAVSVALVLQGTDAFTRSTLVGNARRVQQARTAVTAAPARGAPRFSSPMDEFDPAAREAATKKIQELVATNKVMLFMKGTKLFPQCGFSNTAVSILRAVDAEFETFDVLSDPLVREEIKKFSNWPTIPQCYIAGEFVGGSDILLELFESGELETMLADATKA